jgi:tyrosine-protein phosphatase SIW14
MQKSNSYTRPLFSLEQRGYVSPQHTKSPRLTSDYFPLPTITSSSFTGTFVTESQDETLYPPDNFGMVAPFVYRSGFPKRKNFSFLKRLGLKSILTLVLEDYPDANLDFLQSNDIRFFQLGVAGNKEPFADMPEDVLTNALLILMDKRNHPVLIHCNKGKHRTGCVVACLRKLQHWSLAATFDEYRKYSWPKSREMDLQCIEAFDVRRVWWMIQNDNELRPWMPDWTTAKEYWLPVSNEKT